MNVQFLFRFYFKAIVKINIEALPHTQTYCCTLFTTVYFKDVCIGSCTRFRNLGSITC